MKVQPRNRRLGILVSGRGSNFEAIAANIDERRLHAEIAIVISNVETAPGLARAKERGLNSAFVPSRGKIREHFDMELVDLLKKNDVGLIVLAGFMRIFSPVFLAAYPNLILNIHPALLPSFPGLDVHQQALNYGVKYSGCTVHIVNAELDGGPIIQQAVVPVLNHDTVETLSARILREEHRIYSEAIALVLSGRCDIQGRRVICR
ncbi:MAG TPA: phosphoribosylglycinamide formyltransferase [Terriglobia bacterium]|nr:phosphoribosylglycinamide formyltransferase [Terriglobia bacterium]